MIERNVKKNIIVLHTLNIKNKEKNMNLKLLYFILLVSLFCSCNCTLSPTKPGKTTKPKSNIKEKKGQVNLSVVERDLIKDEPTVTEIVSNYQTYHEDTSRRYFNGSVLGYVTPWNSHGYDVAKIWASKFAYVSPVWLQIKRHKKEEYEITGVHDIDHAWMTTVKQNGAKNNIKILPRILFDGWSAQDFSYLFNGPREERTALVNTIKKVCKQWKFDGFILEILQQISGRVNYEITVDLIKFIALSVAEASLDMILVLPPIRHPGDEDLQRQFDALYPYVTGFSLMTYDFSNPQRPGPNAPLEWVRKCILTYAPDDEDMEKRGKIMLGLNFYGMQYSPSGGGPIVGHEFIEALKTAKGSMKYDDKSVENFIEIKTNKGKKIIFYPTLYSIQRRIDLAAELGTGISIWELGQGLDYFYDLF